MKAGSLAELTRMAAKLDIVEASAVLTAPGLGPAVSSFCPDSRPIFRLAWGFGAMFLRLLMANRLKTKKSDGFLNYMVGSSTQPRDSSRDSGTQGAVLAEPKLTKGRQSLRAAVPRHPTKSNGHGSLPACAYTLSLRQPVGRGSHEVGTSKYEHWSFAWASATVAGHVGF